MRKGSRSHTSLRCVSQRKELCLEQSFLLGHLCVPANWERAVQIPLGTASTNSQHGHFTFSFFQWRIKPRAQHILVKRSATELHPSLVVLFRRSAFHTSVLKTKRSSSVLPTLNTFSFFLLSAVLELNAEPPTRKASIPPLSDGPGIQI